MANEEHLNILKQGVDTWNNWRKEHPGVRPDLSEADLHRADLSLADLSRANLIGADLSGANLIGASLSLADLSLADLSEAHLSGAILRRAKLHQAQIGWTLFGDTNLSSVQGLDTVQHIGPSTIGIDIIYRSKGKIPEAFLRGAGVPENFIEDIGALTGKALEYYSCFISYSTKDQEFADRLYADLQTNGVRCWFAPP